MSLSFHHTSLSLHHYVFSLIQVLSLPTSSSYTHQHNKQITFLHTHFDSFNCVLITCMYTWQRHVCIFWLEIKTDSRVWRTLTFVSSLLVQDKEGRTVDLSDGITVTPVHNNDMHMGGAGFTLMGHGFGKHWHRHWEWICISVCVCNWNFGNLSCLSLSFREKK